MLEANRSSPFLLSESRKREVDSFAPLEVLPKGFLPFLVPWFSTNTFFFATSG
jgi:hypothetical protein